MATTLFVILALSIALASCKVIDLDDSNYNTVVNKQNSHFAFVEYYAPWCGHCKRLAPEYEIVGESFAKLSSKVKIARVDCDQHKELCQREGVSGYPTLKYFKNGGEAQPYQGGRTASDIVTFINSQSGQKAKVKGASSGPTALIDLDDSTFDKIVLDKTQNVFVEFYAPWCGHCKSLEPNYVKFANAFANEKNVKIVRIDADQHKVAASKYGVSGFPTLKWFPVNNKGSPVAYDGERSLEALVNFVNTNAGTQRNPDGSLNAEAGLVDSLDVLVGEFKNAADKKSVLARIEAAVGKLGENDARSGKIYIKAATEIVKGNTQYAAQEKLRLEKMLLSDAVKSSNADDFKRRVNILSVFLSE